MLAKIQHQDNRISALTACALYCAGFLNCARFVDQNQGHLFLLILRTYSMLLVFCAVFRWYVICAHPSNALHLMLAKIQHQDNRISALTACALYCAGFLNCARFVDQNQGHLFLLILRTCAPCLLCRVASGALGIDYLHQRLGKVGSHVDGWPRVPRQRSHL